ncbi:MAG: hypothetical protein HW384_2175 [Dehalococcoidia bacterium]|nr:hypothetical protein [Dehalococcoidia bacterium]
MSIPFGDELIIKNKATNTTNKTVVTINFFPEHISSDWLCLPLTNLRAAVTSVTIMGAMTRILNCVKDDEGKI